MCTEIYYFSGTGNSLHVAKELQKRLPDAELVPILGLVGEGSVRTRGVTVGFVFPQPSSGSAEGSRVLSICIMMKRARGAVSATGCVSPARCGWSKTGRRGPIESDVTAVSPASVSVRKGRSRSSPSGIWSRTPSRTEGTIIPISQRTTLHGKRREWYGHMDQR
jgi:hypothetical protein